MSLCEAVCPGKTVKKVNTHVFLGGADDPPAPGAPKEVETHLFSALEPRPQEQLLLSPTSVSPYSQQKNNPWECVPGPQKGKDQHVPGVWRTQASGGTCVQKIHQHHHLPAPAPGWVLRMSCWESCAGTGHAYWLLLLWGTGNLASLRAARTLNSAGTASSQIFKVAAKS